MDWQDIKNQLYGAEKSLFFPGLQWGGMSADTATYLQSGLNMTAVEEASAGRWRIFSKLGNGCSLLGQKAACDYDAHGEIVSNAYACLPGVHSNNPNEDPAVANKIRCVTSREVGGRGEFSGGSSGDGGARGGGLEFTISVRGSVANDPSFAQADARVAKAMGQALDAILSGVIA